MSSFVYQDDELYHFESEPLMDRIIEGLEVETSSGIQMSPDLMEYVREEGFGFQIIDEEFKEVFQANNHFKDTQNTYTPEELIKLYESDATTVFIREFEMDTRDYSLLLFLDSKFVTRRLYTYDVRLVELAYNPIWLISMNIILLLFISYIYTLRISQPVNRMSDRIIDLSKGNYDVVPPGKGIFENVEVALNALSSQLETSKQERAIADVTREEWISNLSHDIKTPLTSMIGYGELLGDPDYVISKEEREKYKKIIIEKGAYIENLLGDLNLATRLKHQQLPLNMESTELIAEIKAILIDVLNTEFHELNLSFTHSQDEVILSLDRRLFKRVLANLIHNATVHNKAPVTVKVHVDVEDAQWVTITVEDDGIGVKPEELSKVFTRYYRGTHTNAKNEGSGLGLAIAKDIILAHKGTINVEKSSSGGLKITMKLRKENR